MCGAGKIYIVNCGPLMWKKMKSGWGKMCGACWLFLSLELFLKSMKRVKMIFNVGGVNGSI